MMKEISYYIILFIIIIVIVIPGVIVRSCGPTLPGRYSKEMKEKFEKSGNIIALYINKSKKIEYIPLEEYIKGVVAAEMPASFDIEAIKAQAVAARTYAYKRSKKAGGMGCSLHPKADVCDSIHCQAWINKKDMLKKWGIFSFYHYISKINQAVDATSGIIILYNDEPIDPLFFSTSNGRTENSEDVFKNTAPYLRSVKSPGEEISPKFSAVVKIPVKKIVEKLKKKWPDIKIDDKKLENQLKVLEMSKGGRIKKMQVGNKTIKGSEFRMLFNLNSADFKWERSGNTIKFTTKGYGHGVGMSQYGANVMAKKGGDFKDILKYYYSDVELKRVKK